jgi:hypothetical protein
MVQGVGTVNEVFQVPIDVVIVGRPSKNQDFTREYPFDDGSPVIIHIYTGLLDFTGFTTLAGFDLFVRERDELRLDACLGTFFQNNFYEGGGISLRTHTSGDAEHLHTSPSSPGVIDCFDDYRDPQLLHRIHHLPSRICGAVKEVGRAVTVAAAKSSHSRRADTASQKAFTIFSCWSAEDISQPEARIEQEIIDMPARRTIPLEGEYTMPPHAGKPS